MTDITRLLEIPVEATSIVQIFALLHVVWKKKEKKERKNVNAASIEPVTSLDKCRVTFYWVIKCTLSRSTTQPRHYSKIKRADN
jgi:hypothetical protein